MKKTLLLTAILISSSAMANPNFVISTGMHQDKQGKLIEPDRLFMSEAIKAYNQKANGDAFNYFLKAAAFGNTLSQRYIGLMYINGLGIQKDIVTGYAWLKLAKKDKTARNIELEQQVSKLLSAKQKQEALEKYQAIVENYGTIASLTRRERWVHKQMMKMTGTHAGSMVFAPIGFDSPHGNGFYNSMKAYVEDYNFGYVTTGEIVAKDDTSEATKNSPQTKE